MRKKKSVVRGFDVVFGNESTASKMASHAHPLRHTVDDARVDWEKWTMSLGRIVERPCGLDGARVGLILLIFFFHVLVVTWTWNSQVI